MRKILLIAAILLTSTAANATWTNERQITDFSPLLSSHVNPFILSDKGAVEARNLRSNVLYGYLVKRPPMDLYGSIGDYKVTGLHRYYQKDGDKYTIASAQTYLLADQNDSAEFFTIRDELNDGSRYSFATYKDQVIAVNGVDPPQKYDGHILTVSGTVAVDGTDGARTAGILTADLGAPYAELDTGTDLDAGAWYQYRVAHYDGSNYYFSTARSNPIVTGTLVHNIALTDVPLGPPGTTHRYIYRTDGAASRLLVEADNTFNLVGTLSNNSATTFSDNTADGSTATPTWATVSAGSDVTPPIAKYLLIHKERLFLANNPTYPSDLYWSYAFRPDIFRAEDYEPILEDDGDEITTIKPLGGVVVIGKTNSILKLITLSADSDQWQVLGPYTQIGVQAPYSAALTPNGLIYLYRDGIYLFNGESPRLISDIVTPEIEDILWTSRNNVAGSYYRNEYQMAYTSVASGEAENNRVLLFDFQRNSYVIDEKNINVFEVFDSGTDEGTLYSGSSLTDGNITAHTAAATSLVYKKLSEFDSGTFDDTDAFGTEDDPYLEISWGIAFNDAEFTGKGFDHGDYASSIFERPDTDGTWTSPIAEVNADSFDKLYWNEDLGTTGDVTFDIRVGGTLGEIEAASWTTGYTTPSGSDISAVSGAKYVQLRANLTTGDITESPQLVRLNNYVIRLVYNKEGADAENDINALWKTGYMDFGTSDPRRAKRLWEISLYYTGESGSLTFEIDDVDGDIAQSFTVDLSVDPDDSDTDNYEGTMLGKKYTHRFDIRNQPISDFFQYTINDTGTSTWQVQKITTRFTVEEIYD